MAQFEINSWGNYEIDFYNYGTTEEKKYLETIISCRPGCFITEYRAKFVENNLSHIDWEKRIGGIVYVIHHLKYYQKLKEYLNQRLIQHIRKIKLEEINETN